MNVVINRNVKQNIGLRPHFCWMKNKLKLPSLAGKLILIFRIVVFVMFTTYASISIAAGDYFKFYSVLLEGGEVDGWEVSAYQVKEADYNVYPAKLCFKKEAKNVCHSIIKKLGRYQYPFQMVNSLTPLPKKAGVHGVLVKSDHTGTVDGLSAIDIWVYDSKRIGFVNILPNCVLAGVGEYQLISSEVPQVGRGLMLITAERLWRAGEGIDSAHKYQIAIYTISGKGSSKILEYSTSKLYGGESTEVENIIDAELPEILKKIIVIH